MKRMTHRLAAGAVFVALIGGFAGPAAHAAPAPARPGTVAVQGTATAPTATTTVTQANPSTGGELTASPSAQANGIIGVVLKALAKLSKPAIEAGKRAVKAGYASFVAWWNGLPAIVRWIAGGASWEIYTALSCYWFGILC